MMTSGFPLPKVENPIRTPSGDVQADSVRHLCTPPRRKGQARGGPPPSLRSLPQPAVAGMRSRRACPSGRPSHAAARSSPRPTLRPPAPAGAAEPAGRRRIVVAVNQAVSRGVSTGRSASPRECREGAHARRSTAKMPWTRRDALRSSGLVAATQLSVIPAVLVHGPQPHGHPLRGYRERCLGGIGWGRDAVAYGQPGP